jgi:hypothetical protein
MKKLIAFAIVALFAIQFAFADGAPAADNNVKIHHGTGNPRHADGSFQCSAILPLTITGGQANATMGEFVTSQTAYTDGLTNNTLQFSITGEPSNGTRLMPFYYKFTTDPANFTINNAYPANVATDNVMRIFDNSHPWGNYIDITWTCDWADASLTPTNYGAGGYISPDGSTHVQNIDWKGNFVFHGTVTAVMLQQSTQGNAVVFPTTLTISYNTF